MKKLLIGLLLVFVCSIAYGNDANTKLLMHFDADPFTDSSTGGAHGNASETADVDLDTVTYKWSPGSADFDGDSGYLTYSNDADWDILADDANSYVVHFWVKMANHSGEECWLCHYQDGSNFWRIWHRDGFGGMNFKVQGGNETGYVGEITDTNWHHILFAIIGDGSGFDVGVYRDGTQYGHCTQIEYNFTGDLVIGDYDKGSSGLYYDGHMDELKIQHDNLEFGLAPDAGLTDTYDVPTGPDAPTSSSSRVIIVR